MVLECLGDSGQALPSDDGTPNHLASGANGAGFPANGTAFVIRDNTPSEGELWTAVSQLSHGRCGGASGIRAEHIKAWLHGAKLAEDPEKVINYVGEGKTWDEFVELCSSIWATGTVPQQMCWVVTVLIPKGGGSIGESGSLNRFGRFWSG